MENIIFLLIHLFIKINQKYLYILEGYRQMKWSKSKIKFFMKGSIHLKYETALIPHNCVNMTSFEDIFFKFRLLLSQTPNFQWKKNSFICKNDVLLKNNSTENPYFHSEKCNVLLRLYLNDVIFIGFLFILYQLPKVLLNINSLKV